MEDKCLNCSLLYKDTCLVTNEQVNSLEPRNCIHFETRFGYPLTPEELEEAKTDAQYLTDQGEQEFRRYLSTAQDFEDLIIDLKESYNVKHLDDVVIEYKGESEDDRNCYTIYYPIALNFDEEFKKIKNDMMILKAHRYQKYQSLCKEFGGKE